MMEIDIDKERLVDFCIKRQLLDNRKLHSGHDYLVSVSAGDYEILLNLSIKALRERLANNLLEKQ